MDSDDVIRTLSNISELLSAMWVELYFMLFFLLGFRYIHVDDLLNRTFGKPSKCTGSITLVGPQAQLQKSLEANLTVGHAEAALTVWRAGKRSMPTPVKTLKVVAQAFLEADPEKLLQEIIEHIQAHKEVLGHARTVTAVLDVIARSGPGNAEIMDEFAARVQVEKGLQIPQSVATYEVLLGGHAAAGNEPRVQALLAEARASHMQVTPRAYALTVKGFLKNGMLDAALRQVLEMHSEGFYIPSFAVVRLFRSACEARRCEEVFDQMHPLVLVSSNALMVIMEDALKRNDLRFAMRVENVSREANVLLPIGAYESLLKLCIVNSSLHALHVFEDMQRDGHNINEGLCQVLLARCAESKFLCLAEAIVFFLRDRGSMSIDVYSSLMKCYAYCGMYDKACDLYEEIRATGLKPDSMMYGCLMKFSVECGRTELSWTLADHAPSLDIQSYMALIQAAGRDKDVARAFSLLEKLESSGVAMDLAAYSCVLDACVCSGDIERGRSLMEQMKTKFGSLDIVTYNTLLKGYCTLGDIAGARGLLDEMTSLGFPPNDVSFNSMINAAVSKGDFFEAWHTVNIMETSGVPVDQYTLSILMKSLKRTKNPDHVRKSFDLLDRVGIDVCSDEVLLYTVLEACVKHRQLHRLEATLEAFAASGLRPGPAIYGSLIRACGALKRVDDCWEHWRTMIEHRGKEPNDTSLGCMLDALVWNNRVDDAAALLRKWAQIVPPSTALYSTVIKGFANINQSERAMAMWQEMQQLGLSMNSSVYHALIDAQARVGAMDLVSELIEDMLSKGYKLDMMSYSAIVKGYCVKGDLEKAVEVLHGMQGKPMGVSCVIYNTIIDACTKHNRMDLAEVVLDDMERRAIKPSIFTLGILVKMYGRRHDLDKAFYVIEVQARKHGIRPNLHVKTCLMCACLYNHDFARAFRVFEDLKADKQGVDTKVYSALISGIVRNGRGRLPQAVELVREAFGFNSEAPKSHSSLPAPGVQTEVLEQLLRALWSQGQMNSLGVPLLEELQAKQLPVGRRLLSTFLGS